jgi:hypothetical protein
MYYNLKYSDASLVAPDPLGDAEEQAEAETTFEPEKAIIGRATLRLRPLR